MLWVKMDMLSVKTSILLGGADSVEPCETDLFGSLCGPRLLENPAPTPYALEWQRDRVQPYCEREFTFLLLVTLTPEIEGCCWSGERELP
jgi:hypothetical protein